VFGLLRECLKRALRADGGCKEARELERTLGAHLHDDDDYDPLADIGQQVYTQSMLESARRAQIELRMHIFETHFMDGQVEEGASFATKEQSGIWLQYFDFYALWSFGVSCCPHAQLTCVRIHVDHTWVPGTVSGVIFSSHIEGWHLRACFLCPAPASCSVEHLITPDCILSPADGGWFQNHDQDSEPVRR